jgi:diguanylate cyclase (GGDEF)-like protein/PAS domain S-box-containing protein
MAGRASRATGNETPTVAAAPARDGAALLSRMADEADLCLAVLGRQDRIVYANAGFTKLLGFERAEAMDQPLGKLLTENDLRAHRYFGANVPKDQRFQEEFFARTKAGESMWLSGLFRRVFDQSGEAQATAVLLQDITESRIQALQREALGCIASGGSLNELAGLICRHAEGLTPDVICSILRVDEAGLLHPLAAPSLPPIYSQAIEGLAIGPTVGSCGTAAWRGEPVFVADITTDPLWEPYRALPLPPGLRACWSTPIKVKSGRVAGTFAFYFRGQRGPTQLHHKIVEACVNLCALAIEHHEAKAHINRLAYYDHLTGLPNRARLQRDIGKLISVASARPQRVALVYIDIDHFKYVNDTLGHSSGDQLLVEVARRLTEHAGKETILGRMGGDEFLMALPDCNATEARAVASALLKSLCQPVMVDGISLPLSVSIGVAIYPDDSGDFDELLMNADVALYEAKRSGRGICKVFRPEMNVRAEERMLLGAELKDALARGELDLCYQPQVRISDRSVYGVEALTRWSHPSLGNITPDRFIPVAEESGLIESLGVWSLDKACGQLAAWHGSGLAIPSISVNLSALHFRNGALPATIAGTLRKHGLKPHMLTLEITESLMMDDDPVTSETLKSVHALGVGLSMDDFGKGYSSLSALATRPLSELKIDRSFTNRIEHDRGTSAIVTAVIQIGRSLGMTVVAEGVETDRQFQLLKKLGCDVSQGYFSGRPMPPAALQDWLDAQKASDSARKY